MENTLLNLIPAAYLPEIHLSQYDVGRTITFTLKDGASDYSVPSGASVKVKATKPSGLGFEVACTFNGGVVTLVTTDTMTLEYGRFPAELSIVSGNTTIGTSNFIFNIERSPHPEGTIDGDAETILPELTLLVERIEAAADSVDADTQTVTEAKAEVLQAKADTLQAKADTLSARDESVSAKDLAVSSAQTSVEASQRAEQLVGSVETKADAIVKTASGEIASFTDGGDDLPMKSLKVNIVPKQSGSGDPSPSNVRPISGWDSVNVYRTGINITDEEWELGNINANGYPFADSERMRTKNFNPCSPSTQYYVLFPMVGNDAILFYYDINKAFISSTGWIYKGVVTTPSNAHYIKMVLGRTYGTTYNNDISINYPSTDTEYHSYQGTSYPISLGQTVYGGTLDVTSGVLTITHKKTNLRNLNPNYISEYSINNKRGVAMNYVLDVVSTRAKGWCEYSTVTSETNPNLPQYMWFGVNSKYIFWVGILDVLNMTLAEFKTWLSSNDVYIVKEQTPTEVTLTPTEVKTLLGNNNIWADSGEVEVEYRADTTLAYNELLSLIASLS